MFRVGDYHVGVQSNSLSVIEQVASLLGDHAVDDPAAPANLSIYELAPTLAGSRPMYRVYEGCSHVFTTPTLERAVVVTAGRLEQFLPDELPVPGVLDLRTLAFVGHEAAVLAPKWLPRRFPTLELPLRHHGIYILSGTSVRVDVNRGELIARPLRMVPDGRTEAVGAEEPRTAGQVRLGRHSIVAWVFHADGERSSDLSRAHAVMKGLSVTTRQPPGVSELELLAALIRGLEVRAAPATSMIGVVREALVSAR